MRVYCTIYCRICPRPRLSNGDCPIVVRLGRGEALDMAGIGIITMLRRRA